MGGGSAGPLAAVITGGLVMVILQSAAAKNKKLTWLKEWAMGFAVISAMIAGSLLA